MTDDDESWDDPFCYNASAPRDPNLVVLIRDDDMNVTVGRWKPGVGTWVALVAGKEVGKIPNCEAWHPIPGEDWPFANSN